MGKQLAAVLIILALMSPASALAARDYGTTPQEVFSDAYFGFKYSQVILGIDLDYDDTEDDLGNLGIIFGNRINDYLSLEFEYTQTVHRADGYDDFDVKADSIGLFLAAKTRGNLYLKGRFGYARVTQHFDFGTAVSTEELDGEKNVYGLAYGIGGGYRNRDFGSLELELTVYPVREDVEFDFGPLFGTFEDDLETHMISLTYILPIN